MAWVSGSVSGIVTSGTLVVDTGQLPSTGVVNVGIIVNGTVTCSVLFQHMDTMDSTILQEQEVTVLATATPIFGGNSLVVSVSQNERLRIITNSAISTGNISCSIFYSY
jgi:hypothetical protein